ncbi:MAG: hypothetical protein CMJ18_26600, partial [Phycisphaeraceae bacterium]|nr:hypothetical protein [Phycisphaeraceae bacterium]
GLSIGRVLSGGVKPPRYHALVIGINTYRHWPHLRQAKQDAEAVGALLKPRYRFADVQTLYDDKATKVAIIRKLRNYAKTLREEDALLIYFAGHGYYDKLVKRGFWIPTEAREHVEQEPAEADWLPNDTLITYVDTMKARHVLIVSDSCFSGSLMRSGGPDLSAKRNAYYRRVIAQPARWCLGSGDLETVPDRSVFARKFLQVLQYPERPVFSASDIAGAIRLEVAELTGRQPVFGPIKSASGNSVGEFVFLHYGKDDPG